MLKSNRLLFAVLFLLTALAAAAFSADEREKAAEDAASQWLAVVDSGQYGESWFQAAGSFRDAVPKEKWKNMLDSGRAPLGKLVLRQFRSATYTNKDPNAPPGEYVIILYDTSFANAPGMVETVSTTLEKDGKWKVAGYFMKRAGS